MTTKHTPEPWHLSVGTVTVGVLAGIKTINVGRRQNHIHSHFDPVDLANAERIVACVNACQGIPNELLKDNDLRRAVTIMATQLVVQIKKMETAIKEVLNHPSLDGGKVRDILKEALQ